MAIKINNLGSSSDNSIRYTYADLHLDIKENISPISVRQPDITTDYDARAIRNSIINLFNTVPGQKLLAPDYGINLLNYVFEPVTQTTSKLIGQEIVDGIEKFEPRVTVSKVQVRGKPDDNSYVITLIIGIPNISREPFTLNGLLNSEGMSIS